MGNSNIILLTSVLLSLFTYGIDCLTCQQPDGPCKCTTDEGVIDISPLDSKDGGAKFVSIPGTLGETFNYNPCTEFKDPLCSNINTLVCLQEYNVWHPSGSASSASWAASSLDPSALAVSVKQSDGVERTTEITLECDPSKEGEVVGEATNVYTYKMTLRSKYACPGIASEGGGGGLSAGSVLLIIVFVGIIVYLIGGIVFMRYSRGAEGLDMIPNVTFWKALPGFMKDGTVYVVDKVKGSPTTSTSPPKSTTYQTFSNHI